MVTADANNGVDTGPVRDQIARAVRRRRNDLGLTQPQFAQELGNGTSVDAVKKIESGSRSAPNSSDAPSYNELRRYPEIAELIDRLPTTAEARGTGHSARPAPGSTEISLLTANPLTDEMVSIVTSPSLVVAFTSLGVQEFDPRVETVEGRVIGNDTIEIHAPIFEWDCADDSPHYGLRWQCRGPGYFGGYVLSPMGAEIGQSVLELSDHHLGFAGGTFTFWRRHGFAVHILGLAATTAHALHCARTAWDDLATPTGPLLGSGDSLASLRAYSNDSEPHIDQPETG